jgi:Dolichyl-phosphate-mannose-protein mannosyltransferase
MGWGRANWRALALLWLFATGLNLLKPFHLDDTAHLLIAQAISQAPLHPMSGLLNWLDTAQPIFVTNQPHLFFYMIAGVMAVFGASELALHLLEAAFALLAIIATYALARRFSARHALFVTAAIVVSPGFLINQNVMADIPLLALIALAVLALVGNRSGHGAGAAGFGAFSAALMTKYTALFLFPALIWVALRDRRLLVWALLPLVTLVGWGLFNLYDYGAVHILNRPSNVGGLMPSPRLGFALIANLGVFAVPVAVTLMISGRARWLWIAVWLGGLAAFYVVILGALNLAYESWMILNAPLFASAVVVGAAVMGRLWHLLVGFWRMRGQPLQWYARNFGEVALFGWLAGGALFLATFAPFMATRHALLLVPPLFILALSGQVAPLPRMTQVVVLAIWAAVGAFVVGNDISFARFYRDSAPIATARARDLAAPGATVYVRGHWGWQWYARQTDMVEFDSVRSQLKPGDILVDPVGISSQFVADLDRFETIATIRQPATLFTLLDTHRFYASGAMALPVFAPALRREIRLLRVPPGG